MDYVVSTLSLHSQVVTRAEMLREIASAPGVTTEAGASPVAGRSEDVSREFASSFARSRPEIAEIGSSVLPEISPAGGTISPGES